MKMTLKQKAFCEYYAASGNASDAARKAGCSQRIANRIGAENLSKPVIQDYIKQLSAAKELSRFMEIDERRAKLAEIARQDIEAAPASDIIKAIDTLNKMDGLYLQRVEVAGELKNPFANLTDEQLARLAEED